MTIYLNNNVPLENYKELINEEYFVDKSSIIELLNKKISTKSKYVCVTRPRRFGKSTVAQMLGGYYSKAVESKSIFDKLKISNGKSYTEHLNKHNVIYISFNELSDKGNTYEDYISRVKYNLKNDIAKKYPEVNVDEYLSISDLLQSLNEKFIFIFDEWDYIFNNNMFKTDQDDYLEFLRNLLKDQTYVSLVYMTGVLPIKKYSSGSALNMFDEFTMLRDLTFGDYFGFTEEEVEALCKLQRNVEFEEISNWYNGYINENENRMFNPRSVVKALQNGVCRSYWTNTGAMDEVAEFLKYNTLEIREDVIRMVSGEEVDLIIDEEFRAGQEMPKTKEEIYSAMIVLGFLSYYDGYLKIPNKELMKEFEKALKDKSFGYVSEIIENSRKMLKATINKDEKLVEEMLHDIHNSEIPILQYNDENSLSCVVTLAYLSARDTYRVEREEKTEGNSTSYTFSGVSDSHKIKDFGSLLTFHPRRKNDIPFIVELKKDTKPEVAIKQIRDKEYVQQFKKENQDKNILAVAISYDSKSKEHRCLIEEL